MAPKKTVSAAASAAAAALKASKAKVSKAAKQTKKTPASVGKHIVVKAYAGTGKTTTLVCGIRAALGRKPGLTPSPEQAAIWEAMQQGPAPESIRVAAFNKSIATEISDRLSDIPECEVGTSHSFGFRVLKSDDRFPRSVRVNGYKTDNILQDLTGKECRQLRKDAFPLNAIKDLVRLCKINLIDWKSPDFEDQLIDLAVWHNIEIEGRETTVLEFVPRVLEASMTPTKGKFGMWFPEIDFDDMLWLPIVLDLKVEPADWIVVDEAQDLNRAQQELLCRLGRRMMVIGDPHQAIYGFAGADARSFSRIIERLSATPEGMIELPLSVTRRCGHAIVSRAAELVPGFTAHENNPAGEIATLPAQKLLDAVLPGDMVVCRVNAPLVSACFRMLKDGIKARIQGRDIGDGLIRLIKKQDAKDIPDLMDKLEAWFEKEQTDLLNRKFTSEAQLIALQDKYDCIVCFAGGVESVDALIELVDKMFSDAESGTYVKLSSIHRAKGLEAETVYILQPELLPHPMAKSQWQMEQEKNLEYVSYTRAIHKLVLVKTALKD